MQLQKYPEYLCTFFSVFVIHPVVFSGGIVEGQIFSMHFGNFTSATRITPQVGKRARRARRPRRSKLRIFRFRASTKAQSLRCFSSPHKAIRLCGVPKTGEREAHRGQPWQAASCRPICLDTQRLACTQDRLPWLGLKAVKTPSTSCESCQALSALFPIAGARAANTA